MCLSEMVQAAQHGLAPPQLSSASFHSDEAMWGLVKTVEDRGGQSKEMNGHWTLCPTFEKLPKQEGRLDSPSWPGCLTLSDDGGVGTKGRVSQWAETSASWP